MGDTVLVWMSLVDLACESLHVYTECVRCCEHIGYFVEGFMYHIIFFIIHSFMRYEHKYVQFL